MQRAPEGFVIPEEHEAVLRTLLRLEPGPVLPELVVDTYYCYKWMLDRIGEQITGLALIQIAISAGATIDIEPYGFDKACPDCPRDKAVEAFWRNRWVPARFIRFESGKVVVVIEDGTAQERNLQPKNVRLPS